MSMQFPFFPSPKLNKIKILFNFEEGKEVKLSLLLYCGSQPALQSYERLYQRTPMLCPDFYARPLEAHLVFAALTEPKANTKTAGKKFLAGGLIYPMLLRIL